MKKNLGGWTANVQPPSLKIAHMRLMESICGEEKPVQPTSKTTTANGTAPVPAIVTVVLILLAAKLIKRKLLDNIIFLAKLSAFSSECETPGRSGVHRQARKFSYEWGLKIEAVSTEEFSFVAALYFNQAKKSGS